MAGTLRTVVFPLLEGIEMSLRDDLERELRSLHSTAAALPTTVRVSDPVGLSIDVELTQVDSLSCAFMSLTLCVPSLQNAPFTQLEQWADDFTKRVTYLLEKIGPLELDATHGQILIRSTPASTRPQGTQYYQIVLSTSGNGTFTLRRFLSTAGQTGRIPTEVQVTYQVLGQLIEDLLYTIPSPP